MNEIQNINGEITMTSVEVVDLINKFREEEGNRKVLLHNNFMKSIRKEIEALEKAGVEVPEVNIYLGSYVDKQNQERPCYRMNKKWVLQMCNKESALVRYKTQQYIEALENRIEQNTPSYMIENPVERAKRWILEYQEKEKLQIENQQQTQAIEEMTPKADYFDALVDNNLLTNIRDTAKQLHVKQTFFTKWLIENNFCYRDVRGKIKPYADKMKYFELKEFTTDWGHSDTQTLITPRGKEAFRLLLSKELRVTSKKKGLKKRAK